MSVRFDGEEKFRVRIVGSHHPHRGTEGTCDPQHIVHPDSVPMASVRFDRTMEPGVDGCFAAEHELERIDAT